MFEYHYMYMLCQHLYSSVILILTFNRDLGIFLNNSELIRMTFHCRMAVKRTYKLKDAFCLFVFCCLQDLLQEVKQLNRKVEELEGEKVQYERKLRGTKVL